MTDFENLKSSYIQTIQLALLGGVSCDEVKHANELISHFCKQLIRRSGYRPQDREEMCRQIDLVKQTLELEIEAAYH